MSSFPAIDSHAHLYFDKFDDDRHEVLARAREAGFVAVVNVGIDVETSRKALALAREHPGFCFASAGLHPTETNVEGAELDVTLATIEGILQGNPAEIRAVGEIGFDFYWDASPPERQELAFRRQLELAERHDRAVIIHCRDAMADCLRVVAEFGERVRGVFHCFSGDADDARRVLELGWHLSFAGNVTFPKAQDLREAALAAGPERLLLETDAPFLAPQPVRGQRNEPVHSLHTLAALAELFGLQAEELARITTGNAIELLGLPNSARGRFPR